MNMKIDSLNINYQVEGEGESILLLHGWGCDVNIFSRMTKHLSQSYKVYALDLPGFGKSDEPLEPWNVDNYVDLVIKFIKKNKIKKLSLLGHSNGGRIIIKMLNKKLDFEVSKIILVDSAGIKNKKNIEKSFKVRIIRFLKKIVFNKLTNWLFPRLLNKIKSRMGSADYRNASPVMRDTLVKIINEDLTEFLPNINVPALLIWGDLDTATPISDAYLMEKLIPNAGLVVLKGRSHYSFLEDEETVNKVLDSFLGGK